VEASLDHPDAAPRVQPLLLALSLLTLVTGLVDAAWGPTLLAAAVCGLLW
jgi:hypothetical protein